MNMLKIALCLTAAGVVAAAQTPVTSPKPSAAPPKPAAAASAKPAPAPAPSAAVTDDTVVMTVGDQKVTKSQYEALVGALPEQGRANAFGPNKRAFAEQYAQMKTLAVEAKKRGLDKDPEVLKRMALQNENFLAGELYQTFKPADGAVKAYYESHKSNFEQVKASHILIRFKGSPIAAKPNQKDLAEEEALARARELRAKIAAGADFAAIAKVESDDPGSGANGGSLGFFGHGQMVGPFEQAAFSLPAGQISEPVKTQFGYHLIRVDERNTKPFEEVESQVESQLKQQTAQEAMEALKKTVPVVLNESYFGPAPAPQAPVAQGSAPAQ